MSCPCGLSQDRVVDLYQRDLVPLIGGKCQNPLADGSDGICGKALGAHPLAQGYVPIAAPPARAVEALISASHAAGQEYKVFTPEYKTRNLDTRALLIQYIKKCAELFQSSSKQYYAPYCAIIQSSGYGKTALALETAVRIKSYYICLRSASSSATPQRTSMVADSMYFSGTGVSDKKENFKDLFKKMKQIAARFQTANALLQAQNVLQPSANNEFWNIVLQEKIDESTTSRATSSELILVIIDEARSLKGDGINDFYTPLRRALQDFVSSGIFCIMIDTNATIANFAPKNTLDPSERVFDGLELFHPWICIPTIGIHQEFPSKCTDTIRTFCDTIICEEQNVFQFNRFDLVRHSRPMFMDMLLRQSEQYDDPDRLWKELIYFSYCKLFGRPCSVVDTAVAVLAGRFSLIPVDISTQQSLVANKMATLHRCSTSRDRILVSYVAEPILGEGLTSYMKDHFEAIIRELSALMKSGKVSLAGNKGDYGELVAAICLSRAFDFLHAANEVSSRPVMVKEILSLFHIQKCTMQQKVARYPSRENSLLTEDDDTFPVVLGSLVGFLQFIRLSKNLSKNIIEKGFEKRVAFFTCTNMPACDIVIPIFLLRRAEGRKRKFGKDGAQQCHHEAEKESDQKSANENSKSHEATTEDLLTKYFSVVRNDTASSNSSTSSCPVLSVAAAAAAGSNKAREVYTESEGANEFSAIFVQVKHYANAVSPNEVRKLTKSLTEYGVDVLGERTPFITMVMLLGPGELKGKEKTANEGCSIHLNGACVHMVVRGLSSCSAFLSEEAKSHLNQCFNTWIDQELDAFVSRYGFSKTHAQFAAQGMDTADF